MFMHHQRWHECASAADRGSGGRLAVDAGFFGVARGRLMTWN
jgi:hypothetical protein